MSINLTAFCMFVAVFLGVYAVLAPVNELPKDDFADDPMFGDHPMDVPVDPSKAGVFDRIVLPAVRNFLPQTPMSVLIKARNNSKTAELLVRSGNPWNIQPEEFLGLRILGALTGLFAGLLLALIGFLPALLPVFAWMAVGALLGAYLPKVRLDSARGKRRKAAQKGLPEALDLMVITLNAGQNFTPALGEVVKRLPEGIIREELSRVSSDLRAGKGLERSLTDFARRAPSDEVEGFCKAVVQAERLGSDVSDTLKAQAESARQSYEASLDERIGKLPTTLYFPILGLMLPALFIVILAPALSNIGQAF